MVVFGVAAGAAGSVRFTGATGFFWFRSGGFRRGLRFLGSMTACLRSDAWWRSPVGSLTAARRVVLPLRTGATVAGSVGNVEFHANIVHLLWILRQRIIQIPALPRAADRHRTTGDRPRVGVEEMAATKYPATYVRGLFCGGGARRRLGRIRLIGGALPERSILFSPEADGSRLKT